MKILGIDPGQNGALCILSDGSIYDLRPMPIYQLKTKKEFNLPTIKHWLLQADHVVIENVHSMPKQGVSSAFKFGKGFGILIGMCVASGISHSLVTPQKWKKHFGIGRDKGLAIKKAIELYPSIDLLATPRSRTAHDGMAEAYLIAKYYLDTTSSDHF
jgi:crossover junction endodeoxyribonuclease RuvC